MAAALLALAHGAGAHVASTGFLSLEIKGSRAAGVLELAIRDGEMAVGLDRNRDGKVTWGEARAATGALQLYITRNLVLSSDGKSCAVQFDSLQINLRTDGNYLWQPFTVRCPAEVRRLTIDYRLLGEVDPSHRGLLRLQAGDTTQTAVLGGEQSAQTFTLSAPSPWRSFAEYFHAGVWHIWTGADHLLFLLSLLLPAVLVRRAGRWRAVAMPAPALWNILQVVTAFTVAHSITLSLAAFDVLKLPSRLTESVIAASIVVGALNNVFPVVTEARWRIAFGFGLLHGFGFAAVLSEMGLPPGTRLLSLLAFNLGVEAGQLAVVLAVMPVAFLMRATRFYQRAVLPWGSSAIAALALIWLFQRVAG